MNNALHAQAGDVVQDIILVGLDTLNFDTNIRTAMDEAKLQELAESIRQHGQLQPIQVVEGGERKDGSRSYRVVTGHRRVEAAKILGLTTIKAVRTKLRLDEFPEVQLIENLQRENMNAMDEAEAIKRIIDGGKTATEVAKSIGKNEGFISQRVSLLRLSETIREQVREGKIPTTNAIELAKVRSHEKQEQILRAVGKGGVQAIRNTRASLEGAGGVQTRKPRVQKTRTVAEIEVKIAEHEAIVADYMLSSTVRYESAAVVEALKWVLEG